MMRKIPNNYVTARNYAQKTVFILSGAGSGVSYFSFTAVFGTPIGIANAGISLVFLIINRIVKMFLKTMGRKKYA